ncbi:MAG: hypothetical protein ACRCZS_03320 [Chroococcidiopsis sp.]
MEPQEIETNFRLILQICEKNTTDIAKLIQNQDRLTRTVDRLAAIQLAQSRDIAHLTDYIARDED